jgi:hypothetical protein
VNGKPAIVSLPVRGVGETFCCTVYVTDPLPCPCAPEEIDNHASELFATQGQPKAVFTVKPPVLAPAETVALGGDRE